MIGPIIFLLISVIMKNMLNILVISDNFLFDFSHTNQLTRTTQTRIHLSLDIIEQVPMFAMLIYHAVYRDSTAFQSRKWSGVYESNEKTSSMVGRHPKATDDEKIALIEKYIQHFATNDIPSVGHEVWVKMSKDLDGRLEPGSIYTQVRYDRKGHLTQARLNQGIVVSPKCKPILVEEISECEHEELCDLKDNDYLPESNGDERGMDVFDILLTNEEWNTIKPEGNTTRLKKMTWVPVIMRAFWKRYKFDCAFLGRWSYVHSNYDPRVHDYFLKFQAYCQDTVDCRNVMIGTAPNGPTAAGLKLTIKTVDTRQNYHNEVLRPLNGLERKQLGSKLQKESAAHYRDELLRENMNFGENIPHFVRKNHVYRQARMESNKENMGLKPKEKIDMMRSLQKLATDPRYPQTIHGIGGYKFYIIYCSIEQIFVFKEYIRVMKNKSQISIDATGRVVKSFEVFPGKKTGHVFLYTITIKFEKKTICVYQMLTETHTQEFIEYWLKLWVRLGAPSPGEAFTDYAKAIPMSTCLTFNNMSLKDYVDCCFLWAANGKKTKLPVKTLLRIDVAHLMHLVACWKCLTNKDHPYIKNFFLRCVALMIDAKTVSAFAQLFLFSCIVALHPYEDSIITIEGVEMTVLTCLNELEQKISDRKNIIETLEESRVAYEERKVEEVVGTFEEGESGTATHRWIKKLIETAKPSSSNEVGIKPNAFYLPEFVNQLERIGKEFVLWTDIMTASGEHASTAHQEGYFAYLRNSIFEFTTLPCSVNRFVSQHIQSLQSGSNELASKLKHLNHRHPRSQTADLKNEKIESSHVDEISAEPPQKKIHLTDDSDMLSEEQWKGFKNAPIFHVDSDYSDDEQIMTNDIQDKKDETPIQNTSIILSNLLDYESEMNASPAVLKGKIPSCNSFVRNLRITSSPFLDHTYAKYINLGGTTLFQGFGSRNETKDDCKSNGSRSLNDLEAESNNQAQSNSSPLSRDTAKEPDNGKEKLRAHQKNDEDKTNFVASNSQDNFHGNRGMKKENEEPVEKEKITIEKKSKKIPKQGYYFRPHPETKILNQRKTARKRGFLLINGSRVMSLLKINPKKDSWKFDFKTIKPDNLFVNELKVHVIKTWGFDSFVHIIQFCALDTPIYHAFLQCSENETLQFICKFMEKGITKEIYFDRLKILNQFCPISKKPDTTSLSPYCLNAETFITSVWKNCFGNEPSIFRNYECVRKGCNRQKTDKIPFLPIDERIISNNGYQALQQAICYQPYIYNRTCKNPGCSAMATEVNKLNAHICIELDIRSESEKTLTKECYLKDFPVSLTFEETYRLGGVIHHEPDSKHFIAYCLRATGNWLCCDDLGDKIESCRDNVVIKPHAVIYVLQ